MATCEIVCLQCETLTDPADMMNDGRCRPCHEAERELCPECGAVLPAIDGGGEELVYGACEVCDPPDE